MIVPDTNKARREGKIQFEPSKYVLVHYTRNCRQATKEPITVNDTIVEPSSEAKYLGVIFNRELLRFKSHSYYVVVKRGTDAALALASIAKSGWGAHCKYVWQLFSAVIAPRMDYGAVVWHRPKHDGSTASTGQVQKLTTIQRLAMKAITGC